MDPLLSVVRAKCQVNMVVTRITRHSSPTMATFKSFLGCVEFWMLRPMQQGGHG